MQKVVQEPYIKILNKQGSNPALHTLSLTGLPPAPALLQ